jgi:hypothetical protein
MFRRFQLVRDVDPTGISGVGIVAVGCEFPDGVVAMHWSTSALPSSTAVYDRIADVEAIHGHQGQTRVEFID